MSTEKNIESVTLDSIINWLLNKKAMSPKKLQKMLYYAYAWGLVYFNESVDELNTRLFNESFEAWVHGPVIPCVYHEYKQYGYNDIPKIDEKPLLPGDVEELMLDVLDVFGGFSANELERMTHNEKPWIEARGDAKPFDVCHTKLNDKTIYTFYLELSQSGC